MTPPGRPEITCRISVGAGTRGCSCQRPQLVTLAPGGFANALLQIVHAANYPAQKCAPVTAHWLQLFPPNQTVPIYLHFTEPACAKPVRLLTVDVVLPGSGG